MIGNFILWDNIFQVFVEVQLVSLDHKFEANILY